MVNSAKVNKVAEADFPTKWGRFRILGFEGFFPGDEPLAPAPDGRDRRREEAVVLVMGDLTAAGAEGANAAKAPLVRIHSQCMTGDVFHSLRCDCRQQLELALREIANSGTGVLIYEQQEGRGIGIMAKLQAYELQDAGLDTIEANVKLGFEADCRAYNLPVEILKALGLKQIRLMSNNPEKIAAVEKVGIKVVERVSAEVQPSEYAERYLETKRDKMGHLFTPKAEATTK